MASEYENILFSEKRDKEGKKTMTDVIIRDLIKKRKNKKKNKSEI